jgi:hypothetical protein
MAEILQVRVVCDGVDIDCILSNGARHTFHKQSISKGAPSTIKLVQDPQEAQKFVDECEAAQIVVDTITITCEDGTILNA